MINYLPDLNRFKLAGPPAWWLRGLWEFDSSLVVVPSRQDCVYRLAQRRTLNLPAHIVNDALFASSDTRMLASYSLIPVTTILSTAQWSPFMFSELAARAPWRQGGQEKVIKEIEEREAQEARQKDLQTDLFLTDVSKAGWKSYQFKTGAKTFQHARRRDTRLA